MNDNRMKRWMDAIDDDLLEEAQRPLPRSGAARRWGALAACFCAAALASATIVCIVSGLMLRWSSEMRQ